MDRPWKSNSKAAAIGQGLLTDQIRLELLIGKRLARANSAWYAKYGASSLSFNWPAWEGLTSCKATMSGLAASRNASSVRRFGWPMLFGTMGNAAPIAANQGD